MVKLFYKGKEMGHVENGTIKFTKGPDLNPIINAVIGSIVQVEDDMGNVVFEKTEAPLEEKLIYLQEELNFEVREE